MSTPVTLRLDEVVKDKLEKLAESTHRSRSFLAAAASQVVGAIYTQVSLLFKQPALGCTGRMLGTRELVISNTHYLVPYRIRNNTVEILRVFHTSRNPPTNL